MISLMTLFTDRTQIWPSDTDGQNYKLVCIDKYWSARCSAMPQKQVHISHLVREDHMEAQRASVTRMITQSKELVDSGEELSITWCPEL